MRRKIDWVGILNEQSNWHCNERVVEWFSDLVGRRTTLLEGTVEGFLEALGFMRRSVANLHFGEPVDLLWLDTQLKTVTLGLLHHQGAQPGEHGQLPRFRARVKGLIDSDLLRALKDTLLVEFAQYLGDALDGTAAQAVLRCAGVRRSAVPAQNGSSCYGEQSEQRWLDEIELLRNLPPDANLGRCAKLVSTGLKNRFCSDECRFTTLQIAKELEQPGYIDIKPRRYRRRAKQAE